MYMLMKLNILTLCFFVIAEIANFEIFLNCKNFIRSQRVAFKMIILLTSFSPSSIVSMRVKDFAV